MPRAVIFASHGPTDVLEVVRRDASHPGPGEVRVRVRAAGLNPVDWKIIQSPQAAQFYKMAALPSGNGNDFAGVIDEVGPDADGWSPGDEVYGGHRFYAQADFVVVPIGKIRRKPATLDWEQAGALDIAGRTAMAEVRVIDPGEGDTVLVSAAAGGVGVLAAQLALRAGANVVGTASAGNHDYLRSLGVVPVAYGEGMLERLRDAAPLGYTAVLDHHGRDSIDAGLALGVDPRRINTIADKPYAALVGANGIGGAEARPGDLAEIAEAIAAGEIVLPIDSMFPVERVREAYHRLRAGHLRGKIVLTFD
jgi:enoyl reductase